MNTAFLPDPASLRVRVVRKEALTKDIVLIELASVDGQPLPTFTAGAHIDVQLPGGLTRQYSLCDTAAETYQIAVLKEPQGRGGSVAMHDLVHAGSELVVGTPRNLFELSASAQSSLLLAGGIGITPLLCMAQSLATARRPFSLHYCTRSAEATAFRGALAAAPYAAQVHHHYDDGTPEQKLDLPALLSCPQPGMHLYTCGPSGFMDAVLAAARASGWPESQLHYEFFKAEPPQSENDGSFEVQVASTGEVIPVAADETVLMALAAHGIELPASCEQGVCGTCLTRVLGGEPDHRDMYLTPEEQAQNDQFLPCCSRSKSARLVLDI
ncbi:2Fe-2S iron-sulfur cluster binding domain protein [Paraburkholderia xenovorans LB400]|uniref:Vanillate O-demethylase oxidoreductase n=6 Tax=Pseudomonadota TaxID=1224 RepID=A0A024HID3_PSEKB|nr:MULTISPECIES: PDR/VanB family oxidoreductase [Pseudomonadota]MBO9332238.1 2Fe-2S iron-sulfur cluster binding domain-containing protein [Achromobacter xylosoxidans]ABE31846.1 Vanillate O-demethylase reductase subunit, VanB [Paraburkholderia xenovorans LB400]AIP29554.1 2Fe-2S iron-sulfur cluster binding domain protein [Paraburkholderia xenovorans LB400]MDD2013169.1 PDR/VanB family oxidoreductase [Pseudomonas putida]CAB3939938.1 Phthalate dioxygenase reductase [Achromobacter insolitus]